MVEKINTYEPDLIPQKRLDIPETQTGFEDVMGNDGLIETQLNQKVIIQRIAKDLYKNASSGLRELYNNSVRACKIAHEQYGGDQKIVVTMDFKDKKLIIQDFNATGISKERFKKVLLVLGTSDNLDSKQVGQFGMGFASYTTLSSVVILSTKARVKEGNSYQNYSILGKDGSSFQPIGNGDLESFGTKLEMTLYDEVNMIDLAESLGRLAKHSGVNTVLEVSGLDTYSGSQYSNGFNDLEQISYADMAEKALHHDGASKVLKIDNEYYEFYALVQMAGGYNENHVQLVNTPIESEIEMPFSWWILNIKDERKFKPMPDRDRMTEDADRQLQNMIENELTSYFKGLHVANYQDFSDYDRKADLLWCWQHKPEWLSRDMESLFSNLSQCHFKNLNENMRPLTVILFTEQKLAYQSSTNMQVANKLLAETGYYCIRPKKTKNSHWEKYEKIVKDWGIEDYKVIQKRYKIEVTREVQEKKPFEIVAHFNKSGYYYTRTDKLEDIDENYIIVDDRPMPEWLPIIKKWQSPYTFVRNDSRLAGTPARKLSTWLKDYETIVVRTTNGIMTAKEFSEIKNPIVVSDYEEKYLNIVREISGECLIDSNLLPIGLLWDNIRKEMPDKYKYSINGLLEKLYGERVSSDERLEFISKHIRKIPRCHRELFVKLVEGISERWGDDDAEKKEAEDLETILTYVKSAKQFHSADIFQRLMFYVKESEKGIKCTGRYTSCTCPNCNNYSETPLFEKIPSFILKLAFKTHAKILKSEGLLSKSIAAVILPSIFDSFSDYSVEREILTYHARRFIIRFTTTDKIINLPTTMNIQHFTMEILLTKVTINDDDTTSLEMGIELN